MLLDIQLDIQEKDFIVLTGSSGSGKTTLLRVLAGLESADGDITMANNTWLSDKKHLSPRDRNIGFMFQDYALFPNMSVLSNLLFVKKDIYLANHLLDITDMNTLRDRMPNTLSGGQKQRVALCRSMMNNPRLLLMDEPLSALDINMKTRLQNEILRLHNEFNTTTIMVSHDSSQIYKLSNRVIVMEQGKIINDGKAKDIFLKTQGSQKFCFIGEIVDLLKVDTINIAIVSIGEQLVEVVLSNQERKKLSISQKVTISTKAFAPTITPIKD